MRSNLGAKRRRTFATSEGYLGLAPENIQSGDIICVSLGGATPFIIQKEDQECYQLIGEAYVFGIMDGEFVDTNPEIKEVVLC